MTPYLGVWYFWVVFFWFLDFLNCLNIFWNLLKKLGRVHFHHFGHMSHHLGRREGIEVERDRNFTMVNMFRILDHDPSCLY